MALRFEDRGGSAAAAKGGISLDSRPEEADASKIHLREGLEESGHCLLK